MKNVNCEYTGTHQIAWLAYCPRATSMLYSGHNSRKRRRNDGRRTPSIFKSPGLEPIQEKEKGKGVFLRNEMATRGCLPRSRFKGGKYHRGSSPGQASQSSLKEIKPATRWHWKTKDIVAASSPTKVWTTGVNEPKRSLPIFMIHSFVNFCKIMYKAWACGKQRSVLMYTIPIRSTSLYHSIYSPSVQIGRL